jgi:hypothetical protein
MVKGRAPGVDSGIATDKVVLGAAWGVAAGE